MVIKKIAGSIVVLSLLAASLLFADSSWSQGLDISKIESVPVYRDEISDEAFLGLANLIEERPAGDRFLAFRVYMPKGWRRIGGESEGAPGSSLSGVQLSRRIMGNVVRYVSPAGFDTPSRFEVQALELDHEITVRNWFLNHVMLSGYSLEGLQQVSDNRVESLYVQVEKSIPYVVRTVAIINGPRMVLASYYVPESRWRDKRAIQDRVISSFAFLSPERTRLETSRTYAFLDLLRFDYPASWRLVAPAITSIEGMEAKLVNALDQNKLIGEISVRIVSTELETSLPLEVQYLREEIRSMGLEVGDLMDSTKEYQFHPHVNFARVETYFAKARNQRIQDHEYWLTVMAEDRYYYIISMLTPARESEFYNWARNTEAYQMVIESIRP